MAPVRPLPRTSSCASAHKETLMGKYFIAWLLGVPAIFLVILFFFFH